METTCQKGSHIEINAQDGKHNVTLNKYTTKTDISEVRITKPWLYVEWILSATELGNLFYNAFNISTIK
jgi:hypothetical protein